MDCPSCGADIQEREKEQPCSMCGMDKDGNHTWKKYRVEWTEFHSAVIRAESADGAYDRIQEFDDGLESFRDQITGDVREVDESNEETKCHG